MSETGDVSGEGRRWRFPKRRKEASSQPERKEILTGEQVGKYAKYINARRADFERGDHNAPEGVIRKLAHVMSQEIEKNTLPAESNADGTYTLKQIVLGDSATDRDVTYILTPPDDLPSQDTLFVCVNQDLTGEGNTIKFLDGRANAFGGYAARHSTGAEIHQVDPTEHLTSGYGIDSDSPFQIIDVFEKMSLLDPSTLGLPPEPDHLKFYDTVAEAYGSVLRRGIRRDPELTLVDNGKIALSDDYPLTKKLEPSSDEALQRQREQEDHRLSQQEVGHEIQPATEETKAKLLDTVKTRLGKKLIGSVIAPSGMVYELRDLSGLLTDDLVASVTVGRPRQKNYDAILTEIAREKTGVLVVDQFDQRNGEVKGHASQKETGLSTVTETDANELVEVLTDRYTTLLE